jgi:exonuclease III
MSEQKDIYKACNFFKPKTDEDIIKEIEEGKSKLANHIKLRLEKLDDETKLIINIGDFECTKNELSVIISILRSQGYIITTYKDRSYFEIQTENY